MTPWVLRLLIANVAVYFLQQTVPGLTQSLALIPALVLERPWTVVTYMFLHGSLTHILFNMLTFYFFGPRVEARLGSRRFLQLYFISGLAAALASIVFRYGAVIGASGAIYGVLFAFARYWPRERIYIWGVLPIEAWLMLVLYAGFDLFSGLSASGGGVAHFAHLGGLVGAWIFLGVSERMSPARRFKARTQAPAPKVTPTRIARIDLSKVHEVNREELNRILDKISAQGVTSLTNSERTFLNHFASKDEQLPPS